VQLRGVPSGFEVLEVNQLSNFSHLTVMHLRNGGKTPQQSISQSINEAERFSAISVRSSIAMMNRFIEWSEAACLRQFAGLNQFGKATSRSFSKLLAFCIDSASIDEVRKWSIESSNLGHC
jgi:hypothetical protein